MLQISEEQEQGGDPVRYRSPLRYPGGKQRALLRIDEMLPQKVREYREPMVGGGSVFFHARNKNLANIYWINDKFKELIVFWKMTQNPETCKLLMERLTSVHRRLQSPDQLKRFYLKSREREARDDLDTAFLFFFFNRVSFSGTTKAGGFSAAASTLRFTRSSIERLGPLPSALAEAKITDLDFRQVIDEPGKDVFLFLDPPYFTASKLYGKNGELHSFCHAELADLLKTTKHRFLITYDDCKDIRQMYRWANLSPKVRKWQLTYGMNNCNLERSCKVGSELFISNY